MSPDRADERRAVVRRTGIVIMALGVVEILYGVANAPPGAFSLNCLGLLTGLAIFAGNARMVAGVRWLACLELAPVAWMLAGPLLFAPADLLLTQLRLEPGQLATRHVPLMVTLAALIFIARQLGRPEVLDADSAARIEARDLRIPAALGLAIAIGLGVHDYRTLHGDDARIALARAAQRYDGQYRYFIRAIRYHGGDHPAVTADLDVWNAYEVRHEVEGWPI